MKNLSEETIEVNGKEYTLFLNRKGLVSWESEVSPYQDKIKKIAEKYSQLEEALNNKEKQDDDNPFDGLDEVDNLDEDKKLTIKTYETLYWIMLYTHHKMTRTEASKWFDDAIKEYGLNQLTELGSQMIAGINIDSMETDNLKKLKALRPTK